MKTHQLKFVPLDLSQHAGTVMTCTFCGVSGKPSATWIVILVDDPTIAGSDGIAIALCGETCKRGIEGHPRLQDFINFSIAEAQSHLGRAGTDGNLAR